MRNLLISYVCNNEDGIYFGNLISKFEEYPSISKIESEVKLEHPDSEDFTILSIVEFNNADFDNLTKE